MTKRIKYTADDLNIYQDELQQKVDGFREKLFFAREKRVHPLKDDKNSY